MIVEIMLKTLIRVITAIAVVLIFVGGSALDSASLVIPMTMILPAAAWLGILAWANRNTA